jgi:hypothetical protein
MNPDLSRCAQEESKIGDEIRAGTEGFGLRLGAQDWIKEEAMLSCSCPNGELRDRGNRPRSEHA